MAEKGDRKTLEQMAHDDAERAVAYGKTWDGIFGALFGSAPAKPAVDPRDPDRSREGLFQTHDCWRCQHGKKPCVNGHPRDCDNLHARND